MSHCDISFSVRNFFILLTGYSIQIVSVVSIAVCISSSIFSFNLSSDFLICLRLGLVTGCFATKIVQQSSKGSMDVSYVPIFSEILIISCLSIPTKGRNTGSVHTSLVTARLCIVWLATCPILSPVISPSESSFNAKYSAIFIISSHDYS